MKRANAHLRALWVVGGLAIALSILGIVASQVIYGPFGRSFDGTAVPLSYYVATVA